MSKLEKIFSGNWNEIKGKLKSQWGKLTENDIKQIDGSLDELIGKLEKHYGYETAKIEGEIAAFFEENDFSDVKNKAKDLANEAISQSQELKKIITESISEYFDKFKSSSSEIEKEVVNYCKANPVKTAGIVLLAGIALGSLLVKSKD